MPRERGAEIVGDGSNPAQAFATLGGLVVSSLIYAFTEGLATIIDAWYRAIGFLTRGYLEFAGDTLSAIFRVPRRSFEGAWSGALEAFPVAGPADFALGVLIIALTIGTVVIVVPRAWRAFT